MGRNGFHQARHWTKIGVLGTRAPHADISPSTCSIFPARTARANDRDRSVFFGVLGTSTHSARQAPSETSSDSTHICAATTQQANQLRLDVSCWFPTSSAACQCTAICVLPGAYATLQKRRFGVDLVPSLAEIAPLSFRNRPRFRFTSGHRSESDEPPKLADPGPVVNGIG